jgi:hypothetical protein
MTRLRNYYSQVVIKEKSKQSWPQHPRTLEPKTPNLQHCGAEEGTMI